jgi:hypothetical protein
MKQSLFDEMYARTSKAFKEVNLADVIGSLQEYFGSEKFTIWQLFKEEKQKIINQITDKKMLSVESSFRKIYENNYQLMSGLLVSSVAVPDAYRSAIQYVLNTDLKNFFKGDSLEINQLNKLLNEFQKWNINFTDENAFKLAASERIFEELRTMDRVGIPLSRLQSLNEVLNILNQMKVKPNVWKSQTLYFDMLQQLESNLRAYPSPEWKVLFLKLGDLLNVKTLQPILV